MIMVIGLGAFLISVMSLIQNSLLEQVEFVGSGDRSNTVVFDIQPHQKQDIIELVRDYDARTHPICGPLVRGGPVQLVKEHGLDLGDEFVDECHLCFASRIALLDKFPEYLAPRQAYGLE